VCAGERVRDRATVIQIKTGRPVQFEITEQTRGASVLADHPAEDGRVVRDQVRDKLAFAFEDMGEQVKSIARPVRAHRIRMDAAALPVVRR
jgi:hypothetical protein